ncbi:MAG: translation initiation factor IF-3 [Firmicutes bacterium CAG:110_56_8]|nr:MAG: translation initiation factor IF-3 [Firmicutes bacterium CAG:110_56_8]
MEVLTIAKLDHQLNEEIRDKEIRLIGADGAQLGIMSSAQANAMAEEQGMDLVKISPNATPPVCKIMDYSKFCFDQKKREKEASIDTNDFNTKVKAAQKFLNDGNRVKVSVRFRGREMAHTNLGEKLLMDFAASCSEIAGMEKNPKLEGRFMAMFLTPKNSK